MFPYIEDLVKAYQNATFFNDCHPCGGTEGSWAWERSLGRELQRRRKHKDGEI